MTSRVLVTGATGFVGQVLCDALSRSGYVVRAALRNDRAVPPCVAESIVTGDIAAYDAWADALRAVDSVVHVAALAHVMHADPAGMARYVETNANATRRLAEAAARAGVRRFIYLSSVKVNGEETGGAGYAPHDEPAPQGGYAVSKWLGEKHLAEAAASSTMESVIVRSPLVYGPHVRANFLRLMRWVDRQLPLPLGAVQNRRSLVSLWNLCDLLVHLLNHPRAAGRTWMVSDGEDLSTPDLIRRIARSMNRQMRLPNAPLRLLEWAGACVGRGAEIRRLTRSLIVDISSTRAELGWSPVVSVDDAIGRTVAWYLANEHRVG